MLSDIEASRAFDIKRLCTHWKQARAGDLRKVLYFSGAFLMAANTAPATDDLALLANILLDEADHNG